MAELIIGASASIRDVAKVFVFLGGDHGVGAFRLPLRVLVLLKNNTILKKTIGISTVNSNKDSGKVFRETIEPYVTRDLRLLNDSSVVLTVDDSGYVQCHLQPKGEGSSRNLLNVTIEDIVLLITGDIKWYCMLLGMEDMASSWCIYCVLKATVWRQQGHAKGDARTIELINSIVDQYNLTDTSKPVMGVKCKPVWDFIPITHYVLSLLHIQMGIFNDIDDWFMRSVHKMVVWSTKKHQLFDKWTVSKSEVDTARVAIENFDKFNGGKRRRKLLARRNKEKKNTVGVVPLSVDENSNLDGLEKARTALTRKRDSTKEKAKNAKASIDNLHSDMKKESDSWYYAIEQVWKRNGKTRAAYHGGKWNGKDAKAVMKDPLTYDGAMEEPILCFKRDAQIFVA